MLLGNTRPGSYRNSSRYPAGQRDKAHPDETGFGQHRSAWSALDDIEPRRPGGVRAAMRAATIPAAVGSADMDGNLSRTFGTRMVIGGLAGFAATLAMTSAMARLHRHLPERERYPLPPREITERVLPGQDDAIRDTALAAHFLYGGACGALLAVLRAEPSAPEGAVAGVAVWAGSYFGWVPALGILKPASEHPWRRNALMITAHLIWGAATALGIRELNLSRRTILNNRPLEDAAPRHGAGPSKG
jgi:uncharacterized membrane protein YagU involved in acid resistance